MIIGLRTGHSPNCKGAVKYVNEYDQMHIFYGKVKEVLEKYGHKVIDCNSSSSSANGELSEGTRKANAQPLDLFISLHMNAGGGQGCEMWVHSKGCRAEGTAKRLVENMSSTIGIPNRGVKYSSSYYEMRNIQAPNIISELLFVDSKSDTDKYNSKSWDDLSYSFCNAIDSNIPRIKPSEVVVAPPTQTIEDDGLAPIKAEQYTIGDKKVFSDWFIIEPNQVRMIELPRDYFSKVLSVQLTPSMPNGLWELYTPNPVLLYNYDENTITVGNLDHDLKACVVVRVEGI